MRTPHFILWFEDQDCRAMHFGARDSAINAYEKYSVSWNCHLFEKIDPVPPAPASGNELAPTLPIPPCPFCADLLTWEYDSFGTTLYCEGCHGQFTFPAFPQEVVEMWHRSAKKDEPKSPPTISAAKTPVSLEAFIFARNHFCGNMHEIAVAFDSALAAERAAHEETKMAAYECEMRMREQAAECVRQIAEVKGKLMESELARERMRALASFGQAVLSAMSDHAEVGFDEWMEELAEIGFKTGVVERVEYNRELHGDQDDCFEPGDEMWWWGNAPAINPPTGALEKVREALGKTFIVLSAWMLTDQMKQYAEIGPEMRAELIATREAAAEALALLGGNKPGAEPEKP